MRFLLIPLLFTTLLQARPRHHFLWVVDNSGSMQKQREIIAKNIPEFLTRLQKYGIHEYRMGVTTTDNFTLGGKLVSDKMVSNEDKDPATEFSQLLKAVPDSSTSFWEQGLEASKGVAERFLVRNEPLILIFVSDEDDYSCQDDCYGPEPENNSQWKAHPVERYIDYYNSLKKQFNVDVSAFPIIGVPEGICQVASLGLRYMKLRASLETNIGVNGSICDQDLAQSVLQIAEKVGTPDIGVPSWTQNPIKLNVLEKVPFFLDLTSFVKGNQLVFSIISAPFWAAISPSGTVFGTPPSESLGENHFVVRAMNSVGNSADAKLILEVTHTNQIPHWETDPIDLGELKVGEQFYFDLSKHATDPDNDPMNFVLLSGPIFLKLDHGILSGIPKMGDLGKGGFTARVFDMLHSGASDVRIVYQVVK